MFIELSFLTENEEEEMNNQKVYVKNGELGVVWNNFVSIKKKKQ